MSTSLLGYLSHFVYSLCRFVCFSCCYRAYFLHLASTTFFFFLVLGKAWVVKSVERVHLEAKGILILKQRIYRIRKRSFIYCCLSRNSIKIEWGFRNLLWQMNEIMGLYRWIKTIFKILISVNLWYFNKSLLQLNSFQIKIICLFFKTKKKNKRR